MGISLPERKWGSIPSPILRAYRSTWTRARPSNSEPYCQKSGPLGRFLFLRRKPGSHVGILGVLEQMRCETRVLNAVQDQRRQARLKIARQELPGCELNARESRQGR